MKQFVQLFTAIDQTTSTLAKVAALATYLAKASERDKLWTMAILSHRRPKRTVSTALLRAWAAEQSALPLWLFEESYHIVGDLAETIALVLPPPTGMSSNTLSDWIDYIKALEGRSEEEKKGAILEAWSQLDYSERFLFNKFITGGFRMGVSQKLMVKALSKVTEIEEAVLAHRLMGHWEPDQTSFEQLVLTQDGNESASRPYPFYLAYALEQEVSDLGSVCDWQIEWKWDGIRGQVIVRDGQLYIWSRGEELVTEKFPELAHLAEALPDGTVVDGELMAFRDGQILPFGDLQQRIGRKNITKSILKNVPVVLRAYDLLELGGRDIRIQPLSQRRALLETLFDTIGLVPHLQLSACLQEDSWEAVAQMRAQSRDQFSEGLMLKSKKSTYQVGRKKGDWWKWKIDPMTIDAVMLYAQRGHGRRANLYTDFTFAVWDGEALVPFAKAYSGLTDAEFKQITAWVNKHTIDKFGPVRSVQPALVFELAFEGIQASNRHKCGVALRFPRILRWRKDKPVEEANHLKDLLALL